MRATATRFRHPLVLVLLLNLWPLAAHAEPPKVLFDQGHGQKFRIEAQDKLDLSKLAAVFRDAGCDVQSTLRPLTDADLTGVKALVISGPFAPLTPDEVATVSRFLERGGSLALMLHIPFPMTGLLRPLHVDFSNGVIRERENLTTTDPLTFRVTSLTSHPLTRKLDGFTVVGAWALLNEDPAGVSVARTSGSAWVDLNSDGTLGTFDVVQSFAVVVAGQLGDGRYVVFGDDAIFQNDFLTDGNAVLAKNLACWLARLDCDK